MTDPLLAAVPAGTAAGSAAGELTWADAMTWDEFELLVTRTVAPFDGRFETARFNYIHPVRLQGHWPAHLVKDTPVRLSYTEWGDPDAPALVCAGGILNTARRWDYLAAVLSERLRVVCLDWPGRGISGWLPTQGDYGLETNVEVLVQLLRHLDVDRASFIGSSHGGSVCLALAARHPERVDRLVLNDIGPYMAVGSRQRRAQAVARHYVFRKPAELFRRLGVSSRGEGPVTEDQLLHNTYFQTRWSESHGGRVYRHDPRALQAYAEDAADALDQWDEWDRVACPVLVVHGLLSDALVAETVARMTEKPGVVAMHVPDTGHMPALSNDNQVHFLRGWLYGEGPDAEFTCLNPQVGPRRLFTPPAP